MFWIGHLLLLWNLVSYKDLLGPFIDHALVRPILNYYFILTTHLSGDVDVLSVFNGGH